MKTEYKATIHPQYDANGYDCGLWLVYDTSLGYETPVYEHIDLRVGTTANNRGTLYVGQFVDWDNESYDECGNIDAEYIVYSDTDPCEMQVYEL
mgnify:CR=1 FL=1